MAWTIIWLLVGWFGHKYQQRWMPKMKSAWQHLTSKF